MVVNNRDTTVFNEPSAEDSYVWSVIRPKSSSLARLRCLSIRNRTWFAVLNWKQRRFIDIVINTVNKIHSILLLKVLAPLVKKLLLAINSDMKRASLALMREEAYKMMRVVAKKIVQTAEGWGNKTAHKWLSEGFIRFLVVMNLPQNKNSVTFGSQL